MKMINKFIFITLICAFITSCSYDFQPDNFIEIELPSSDVQYIELNEFTNLDTINIQRVLTYKFNGEENQNKIESEVYLDNQLINSSWEIDTGTFSLYPANYEDGIHNIRIEHTFTSGSGSIADQAQVEILQEIAEYQFIVNRLPSNPPDIITAEINDGTIDVTWETNYETDFINAYLSLQFSSSEIRIPLTNDILSSGFYNDDSTVLFVGNSNTPNYDEFESVTYSIVFESEFEELYGQSKSISFYPTDINVEIAFVDYNSYKLKWSAHPMYSNFDTFQFSYLGGSFTGSSEGGEQLVETSYVFGQEYSVNVRPLNTPTTVPIYTFYDVPLDNETFGEFSLDPHFVKDILYNPSTNHYYTLVIEDITNSGYEIYIYEYSEDMEFVQNNYVLTYDGVQLNYLKLVLDQTNNNFYLNARNNAYKINGTTLNIMEQYNDPPFTSEFSFRGNILCKLDSSTNVLTVTNIETNTLLYSEVTPATRLGHLSSTGEYILISNSTGNKLYRIVGDQLIEAMDFTSTIISKNMQIVDDIVYYAAGSEIFIVNLSTNQTRSFNFGSTQQSVQYDALSQNLLASQNGNNIIFNTITEETISFQSEDDKFPGGTFSQSDRDYLMHIQNGRLIHSKGIYIDID